MPDPRSHDMLTVIRSNLVEALLERLADRLSERPLASPLARELVVVPSPAMARWVNLQLARRFGVAANLEYPLPASFVWATARALLEDLPETDPLGLDAMTWKIFGRLADLPEPELEPLRQYLVGDLDGLKRWQLAGRIADAFDRYQLYRPELIRGWERGGGDDWQSMLWRELARGVDGRHRVAITDRLLGVLAAPAPLPARDLALPERVSLFALSTLPPLFVQVVHALGAHAAVDLYLHAPTQDYWSDLVPLKRLARQRLERPQEAELWEVGNSLLASWGRQGQALQDLLLDQAGALEEIDAFVPPTNPTLLGRVQRDIFQLRPMAEAEGREALAADDSLQVHICHSPLRECQVLHDQLLGMFEAEPELRPEDVLVMVPEIGRYAPYIQAVFDRDRELEGGGPFIPWNLSDIALSDEHPLVLVFLRLLDLGQSRFTQSEVLSYLDEPELARRFGLDGDGVAEVRGWLARANLRWGRDGEHKRRLGLPALEENTWAQAERRLFGGYALGEAALFDGIAPIGSVEGTGAEVLGRFWRFFSRLEETAGQLELPRTATGWQEYIGTLLAGFFGEREDPDGRLQKIRDAVADLSDQAGEIAEPLSAALVRAWLRQRLGGEPRHGRLFSGGVSFCGMRPLRSLPFRVICILGLQDQAFPRRERPSELDRMRKDWRPGDPRKGDEDRYLFLETLLCARRRLYLSYVGRDVRKNTERQPSVLVRELLDYLDQQFRVGDGAGAGGARPSASITRVHPLQPFSPRAYSGAGRSFDGAWCEVARGMVRAPDPAAGQVLYWSDAPLPERSEPMRELPLRELERFLAHPVRSFVSRRLRLSLGTEEAEPDDETFALDGLQSFALKQRLLDEGLARQVPTPRQLSAEGGLPHGAFAELVYEQQTAKVAPLFVCLEPYRGMAASRVGVDLQLECDGGPCRLSGQVGGIYPGLGLMRCRPGTLRGADLLGLWLAHLAWCANGDPGPKRSRLFASDGDFVIHEELEPRAARSALGRYVELYREGMRRPLLMLPRASFAYAQVLHRGGRADPMKAAWTAWKGNGYNAIPGDRDDAAIRLVMRGVTGEPLESPRFIALAQDFFAQALGCGELTA